MEEIGVSFIIALKNGDDIVLVADKMLQKSNLAISTEQKKILDYSRNVTTAVRSVEILIKHLLMTAITQYTLRY